MTPPVVTVSLLPTPYYPGNGDYSRQDWHLWPLQASCGPTVLIHSISFPQGLISPGGVHVPSCQSLNIFSPLKMTEEFTPNKGIFLTFWHPLRERMISGHRPQASDALESNCIFWEAVDSVHEIMIVCQHSIDPGFVKLKVCLRLPIKMNGHFFYWRLMHCVYLIEWKWLCVFQMSLLINLQGVLCD